MEFHSWSGLINTVLSSLPTAPEPAGDNSNYPDDDDIGPDGGYDMEEDQVSERALGHSKIFCASVKGTFSRDV